jgi:3-oxoadipate enol-lactonase
MQSMALMQIGHVEINVRQWGRGEPLVLVHGLGANAGLWIHQVRPFSERYRVIALDLRGFGRSSKPPDAKDYSIDLMTDDVIGVCRALDLPAIHFLGSSMGGFIGQTIALEAPELVRSVMLCHTGAELGIPPDVMAERLQALNQISMDEYAGLVASQALAQPPDPIVDEWLREMIAGNAREPYVHVLAGALASFDMTERVHAIRCPAIVVAGSDDRVIPPEKGKALSERIEGCEYHLIDGVGHIGYAEKPDAFNRIILEFLSRQHQAGEA